MIRDKISLAALESHIQRKKEWRDKLIANHSTIRSSSSDKITTSNSPRPSIRIINEGSNLSGFEVVDKSTFPNITSTRSSFQIEASHEDRITLKSQSNVMRNTRSSFADDNTPRSSPKAWSPGQSNKPQKKESSRSLMSSEFSFATFKKGSESNPIYDKQMNKLRRKLKEDQNEEDLNNAKGPKMQIRITPISSESLSRESMVFAKTPKNLSGFASPRQNTEEKSNNQQLSIKPKRDTKHQSLSEGKPMLKLFKTLGLDKIYLETEYTPICLSTETTTIASPLTSVNDITASRSLTSRFNTKANDQRQELRPLLNENSNIYYNGARMGGNLNPRGSKLNLFYRNSKNFTTEGLEL